MVSKYHFQASVHGLIEQVQLLCSTGRTVYQWSTEFQFHPTRRWKFDLAIHEPKIAAEYQGLFLLGGSKGGHQTIKGLQNDWEKAREGQLLGWMVLFFSPDDVRTGEAMNVIARAISLRRKI